MLHVRVVGGDHVRRTEPYWSDRRDCNREVVFEADLSRRVLPDRSYGLAARRARTLAARIAVHGRRRLRAPLLLRFRLGGVCRATRTRLALANAPTKSCNRLDRARDVRRYSRVHGRAGIP